jgi:hypothetical protein
MIPLIQPTLKPNFGTSMIIDNEWHVQQAQNLLFAPVDGAPEASFNDCVFASNSIELTEMICECPSPNNFDSINCVDEIVDHSDKHVRSSPVQFTDGFKIDTDKYAHEQQRGDASDVFDYERFSQRQHSPQALALTDALGHDGQRVNVTDSELPPVRNASQQLYPSKSMQPHRQSSHTTIKLAKVRYQLYALFTLHAVAPSHRACCYFRFSSEFPCRIQGMISQRIGGRAARLW